MLCIQLFLRTFFFLSFTQMVMEFPDNVLNLDGHQNNNAQLKQFIQVSTPLFFRKTCARSCFLQVHALAFPGGCHSWNDLINDLKDTLEPICNYVLVPKYTGCIHLLCFTAFIHCCLPRRQLLHIQLELKTGHCQFMLNGNYGFLLHFHFFLENKS